MLIRYCSTKLILVNFWYVVFDTITSRIKKESFLLQFCLGQAIFFSYFYWTINIKRDTLDCLKHSKMHKIESRKITNRDHKLQPQNTSQHVSVGNLSMALIYFKNPQDCAAISTSNYFHSSQGLTWSKLFPIYLLSVQVYDKLNLGKANSY